jgi:hypothetical protein
VLSKVPPIDYPDGVLDLVLQDADDWE